MKAQITNPRKSISASLKRSFANCRPVHTLPPLEPVPEAQLQNTSNHEIRKDKYSDPIGHQEWSTHDNQYLRENTACMEKFSPLSSAFHDDIHEMIHVAEQQREKSEQQVSRGKRFIFLLDSCLAQAAQTLCFALVGHSYGRMFHPPTCF